MMDMIQSQDQPQQQPDIMSTIKKDPEPNLAPGEVIAKTARGRGATEPEVLELKSQIVDTMKHRGASAQEINDFFGVKDVDDSGLKKTVTDNLKAQTGEDGKSTLEPFDHTKPLEENDYWGALKAGWGDGIISMKLTDQKADQGLGPNSGPLQNFAYLAGRTVGDTPTIAAGMIAGGGPETPAGWGAAAALTEGARSWMVDRIKKGEITDSKELAARFVHATSEAYKAYVVGALTFQAGNVVRGANAGATTSLGKALTSTPTRLAAEAGAMTTVASALENHIPSLRDFENAAVAVGGLHAVGAVTGGLPDGYVKDKLMNIWSKTGIRPDKTVEAAHNDPVFKTEILSQNPDLPIEAKPAEQSTSTELRAGESVLQDKAASPPPATEETPKAVAATKEYTTNKQIVEDAKQHLLEKIGEAEKPKDSSLAEKARYNFDKVYREKLDWTAALKDAVEEHKDLDAEKNPHIMARLFNAIKAKERIWMQYGTEDQPFGKINGEGFEPLIKDYQKATGDYDMSNFDAYGIGSRAMELKEGREIEQGVDVQKAKAFVEAHPEIRPFLDRFVAFRNRGVRYLQKSGVLSEDDANAWEYLGKSYFPFKKIMEPDPITGMRPSGSRMIKKIGSSDRQITEPMLQTYKDISKMIELAHENYAKRYYVDALKDTGMIKISEDQKGMPGESQIEVYENGKRTLWDVPPEHAEAIKAFAGNKTALPVYIKALKPFGNLERTLTVDMPTFAPLHAFRQQITGGTLSKTGYIPFITWMQYAPKYIFGMATNSQAYVDFVRDGGSVDGIMKMEPWIDRRIYNMEKERPILSKAFNQIKTIGEFSHYAITLHDNVIRFAEQQRTLEGGGSRAEAAFAAREILPDFQKAGLQHDALMTLTPFLRVHLLGEARMFQEFGQERDNIMKAIESRNLQDLSKSGGKLLSGYIAKNIAFITTPALLIAAAHHGDDAYNGLARWLKYGFFNWHLSNWRNANSDAEYNSVNDAVPSNARVLPDGTKQINDGQFIRLQKPFSNGIIFGSAIEATIDAFKNKNPKAFEDFVKNVVGSFAADFFPPGIKQTFETIANYNSFTGQPIIRHSMEDKLPEARYDRQTSEIAKKIAGVLHAVPLIGDNEKLASPVMVENWIHSMGSGSYFIESLVDKALRDSGQSPPDVRAKKNWSETFGARQFMYRYPELHPQAVDDFEQRFHKVSEVYKTASGLAKNNDESGIRQLSAKYPGAIEQYQRLNGAWKELQTNQSNLTKFDMWDSKGQVTGEQKRQIEDMMMYRIMSVAKHGNELLDKLEEQAKQGKKGK